MKMFGEGKYWAATYTEATMELDEWKGEDRGSSSWRGEVVWLPKYLYAFIIIFYNIVRYGPM